MDIVAPASEQVLVFLAVVDQGSFSAAARHLRRAQSAVTYAIQELEADLGVILFDRSRHRPTLTPAGAALLGNARRLAQEIAAIQRRAHGLKEGLEPELTIVVNAMFPMPRLVGLVRTFNETFPTVPIRLYVESLGAAAERVLDGTCTIGITGELASGHPELLRMPIGTIARVPVVAPTHPLASWRGDIPFDVLSDYVQLVVTNREFLSRGRDFGVISPVTWRVNDYGAKHALILAGFGWGGMPLHMVERDLREGRLVRLHSAGFEALRWASLFPVYAVHRIDTVPGPAGRWMLDYLRTVLDGEPQSEPRSKRAGHATARARSASRKRRSPRSVVSARRRRS